MTVVMLYLNQKQRQNSFYEYTSFNLIEWSRAAMFYEAVVLQTLENSLEIILSEFIWANLQVASTLDNFENILKSFQSKRWGKKFN